MTTSQTVLPSEIRGDRVQDPADRRLKTLFLAYVRLASSTVALDEYLSIVTETLMELTDATSSVVEWIDGAELVYRAAAGPARAHLGTRLPSSGSLSGLCAEQRAVFASIDTSNDPRVDRAACEAVGAGSMVVGPVVYDGKVTAVLKLIYGVKAGFSQSDIETLEVFSSGIAATMAQYRDDAVKRRLVKERADAITNLNVETSLRQTFESRLADALRRRRTILDSANEAFISIDRRGRIIDWNEAATRTFGWRGPEALGQDIADLIIPARYRLAHRQGLARFMDTGESRVLNKRIEMFALRRDGEEFPAEMVVSEVSFAGQLQFACFLHDITERHQKAQADENFRLLIHSVQDYAIFMLDPDGTVSSWNEGARAIKGYEPGEIIGRHFSTFYPPDDLALNKPGRALKIAAELGRFEDEGWRVRKDGTLFWANVVVTAIRDELGSLKGYAKVTRDMTQRRRLEELERSSRRMNEFLALLGHELRNPLAPIRNAVSILKIKATDDPDLIRSRNIVDRQLAQLTRLVDDLLDAARITSGKIHIDRQRISINDVLQLGVEGSQPLIQARNQSLEISVPSNPVFIIGDTTRLIQVLQNLLNNASKFSPQGASIRLSLQEQGDFVVVSVADNGRGIAPSALNAIFGLFVQEQAPGAQLDEGGLGIGLTLARAIIELHGGHIEAASSGAGKGSTFTVSVPKALQQAEPIASEKDGPALAPGLRVLIVDDNRDSADSMAMLLDMMGHEVKATYDGEHAIALAPVFQPDVVMLDLSMPGMTGFETLPLLRAAVPAKLVAAAMTGLGSDEDKARTTAAGFDVHLTKPVELRQVEALLKLAHGLTC
jgi:PAS domain S-box-containing protein